MIAAAPSPTSSVWAARRSSGGDAALWASAGLGMIAAVVLGLTFGREPDALMVVLLVATLVVTALAVALLAWGLAYRQLRYSLREEGIQVSWLGGGVTLPYRLVDGIYPGQRLVGNAVPKVPSWPGIYVGPGRARGIGRLHFYATSPDPADLLLITAQGTGLVLSAQNAQAFRTALIESVERHEAAPPSNNLDPLGYLSPRGAPWSSLRDPWALGALLAGLAFIVATIAVIALPFQGLPDMLPMRFNSSGSPLVELKGNLFRLPLGGLAAFLISWLAGIFVHPSEPVLARILWISASLVQAILLVATIRLLQ